MITEVGNYPIVEHLPHGALGPRFASLTASGAQLIVELVAIRGDAELFERALRRLTVLATVRHKHLTPIIDAGLDADHFFLVTPRPRRTADEIGIAGIAAAHVMAHVARGLAHLHTAGVVHRDIQLCHIGLLNGIAQLGGCGLADVAGARTRGIGPIGAVSTMAPSLVRGRPATRGSDVYSFGAALHLLATGEAVHPLRDESLSTRIARIGREAPQVADSLPVELRPVVEHALAVDGDPGDQCRRLHQFIDDLAQHAPGHDVIGEWTCTA